MRDRRVLAVGWVVLIFVAIVAAGCGGGGTDTSTGGGSGASSLKLAYIAGVKANPAYTAVGCGVEQYGQESGASIEVQEPDEFTASSQIPVVNATVQSGIDGLVISPNNASALQAPLEGLIGQGIPVATALNAVAEPEALTSAATSDEVSGGKLAAELVAKALDEEGTVGVVTFTPGGSSATDGRLEGFEAQIKEYPNIDYVGFQVTNSLAANDGAEAANALLAANPGLSAIVTTFPDAAVGVATALRQQHKEVYDLAFDAVPGTLNALENGSLDELINFDYAKLGVLAAEQLVKSINGESVKASQLIPPLVVTPENIDKPSIAKTFQLLKCPS